MLGINADGSKGYDPASFLAEGYGFQYVRTPLWQDIDQIGYLQFVEGCKIAGLEVLAVCDGRTLGSPTKLSYYDRFRRLRSMYPTVRYWQIANEPDQKGESSWTLAPARFSELLAIGCRALRDRHTIAGGLASGDPSYLDRVDLPTTLDAIAVHAYGVLPTSWPMMEGWFTHAGALLERYKVFDRCIWITEVGAQDSMFNNMTERESWHHDILTDFSANNPAVFCWDDDMVPEYGVRGKFVL